METVTRVQSMDKTVCISHGANIHMNYIHPTLWPPVTIRQTGLFNLRLATNLGEGKLCTEICSPGEVGEILLLSFSLTLLALHNLPFNQFPNEALTFTASLSHGDARRPIQKPSKMQVSINNNNNNSWHLAKKKQ